MGRTHCRGIRFNDPDALEAHLQDLNNINIVLPLYPPDSWCLEDIIGYFRYNPTTMELELLGAGAVGTVVVDNAGNWLVDNAGNTIVDT